MRFKVGDKVRIKRNIQRLHAENRPDSPGTNETMIRQEGRVCTIRLCDNRLYRLVETEYYWADFMLEPVYTSPFEIKDHILIKEKPCDTAQVIELEW